MSPTKLLVLVLILHPSRISPSDDPETWILIGSSTEEPTDWCVSIPPVQVLDQTLTVAGQNLSQQLLVLPEQVQVVGDGEGLQGQTGEGLHRLHGTQVKTEVVPGLCSPCYNRSILDQNREET